MGARAGPAGAGAGARTHAHKRAHTSNTATTSPLQLSYLEGDGVLCSPQFKISLPELEAQCGDEAGADTLFGQLSTYLGAPGASLCIKPQHSSAGLGVAR